MINEEAMAAVLEARNQEAQILGVSDIRISIAITFMLVATVVLYIGCARLLVSGRGMRT